MLKLAASSIIGEYEGEEGGGCPIFPMEVFSETLNAHEASEADNAADGEDMFPVNLANDGSARSMSQARLRVVSTSVFISIHLQC